MAKAASVSIIKSAREQDKFFASLATTRKTLEADMHRAACSVLWHLGQHKDIRQVDKLFASLEDTDKHTSILTNSLRAWFEEFGNVTFDQGKVILLKDKGIKLGPAMELPFWKFKPQSPYLAVDTIAMLDAAIKKLVKDQKEVGADHAELIASFEAAKTKELKRREAQNMAPAELIAGSAAQAEAQAPTAH